MYTEQYIYGFIIYNKQNNVLESYMHLHIFPAQFDNFMNILLHSGVLKPGDLKKKYCYSIFGAITS